MYHSIKTCVLGVGLSGLTFHVPFILALPELFTLTAVLERNPSTPGGKAHARFGVSPKIHKSFEDVLNDDEIELVIIGTPNDTHYDFAKRALQKGKHVLVDKPVTTTVAEAKELGALAKDKGLVLYAFQNRRWDSDFLTLRKLLALPSSSENSLGTITSFESRFDRYRAGTKGTWKDEARPGAGQTYDLGTHLIDQTLVLFGRPATLTAFIRNTRHVGNPAVDDTFSLVLHYPRVSEPDLTVTLGANILSARKHQVRYVVQGTKGTYEKRGVDVQEDTLKVIEGPKNIFDDSYGAEPEGIWGRLDNLKADGSVSSEIWPSTERGRYVELFKNLAGAIRGGDELAVKWEESTAVIELVELAYRSAKEGRTVEVPKA
ncbi:hypothetical protein PLICRDRAFT_96730 [Plicaturopsis crispa FD-325 SS-3]|nr:hypothetical protein PLICRDRAFT_96730 [Plicaturopsis crispa FD-325 SS-3]